MNNIRVISLFNAAFLLLLMPLATSASPTSSGAASACPVDPAWLTSPSLPVPFEVKRSGADGSSDFCDFYQFSTQTFLYLMSESSGKQRNFQVQANYPL